MQATVSYRILLTGIVLAIIAPLLYFAFFYAMYPPSENMKMFVRYTDWLYVVFTLGQAFIFVGARKLCTRIFAFLNVMFFVIHLLLFFIVLPNVHGDEPVIFWLSIMRDVAIAYFGAGIFGLVSACVEIVGRKSDRGTAHGTSGGFSTTCDCSEIAHPECGTPVSTDEGESG